MTGANVITTLLNASSDLALAISPIIALYFLINALQRITLNNAFSLIGVKGVIATGLIGVTLHEVSHAIMCFVFRHKVHRIVFFSLGRDGTLGYLEHSYNIKSLYQRIGLFFIGFSPLYFAFIYFYFSSLWMIELDIFSQENTNKSFLKECISYTFELWNRIIASGWWGAIWFITCTSIALHMMPSRADLRGALGGGISLLIIFCLYAVFDAMVLGAESSLDGIFKKSLAICFFLTNVVSVLLILAAVSLLVRAVRYTIGSK